MAIEFRRMQQLRGTAEQWDANDVVLLAGEIALQIGPGTGEVHAKVGDGASAYSALSFVFEIDQTARDQIAALDSIVVSIDSRVTALEDAASGGGSMADLAAQVAANTDAIAIRQLTLPDGANPGDVLYWDGTTYAATALAPAPGLATMLYWDNLAGAYVGVGGGAPGQALVLNPSGIPTWTTNPAAGVAEAPNDGFIYGRAALGWVALPPPMSCSVGTIADPTLTLAAVHTGARLLFTNAAGCVVTAPTNAAVPIPIGARIELEATDATGAVSIAGASGVTVRHRAFYDPETAGQYAVILLVKTGTDEWSLSGDLAEA